MCLDQWLVWMPDEQHTPTLRLDLLAFPTDSLTVADLRRAQPILFSEKGLFHSYDNSQASSMDVLTFMLSERILAQKAFAAAAGLPDPWPDADRREEVKDLNCYYVQMGLSSGLRHTQQLVRAIEAAAAAQAGPSQSVSSN